MRLRKDRAPMYINDKAREYEASLWARKDEEIRFHIKFSKGSHVNFTWMLEASL